MEEAERERVALEAERNKWKEQVCNLREDNSKLTERQKTASESLRRARADTERLQTRRAVVQAQLAELSAAHRKLRAARDRAMADAGSQNGMVQSICGMTWQELKETKKVCESTSQALQNSAAVYEQQRREASNFATAHSKRLMLGTTMQLGVKMKLPDPNSMEMRMALTQAQAASSRAAMHSAELREQGPARGFAASGGQAGSFCETPRGASRAVGGGDVSRSETPRCASRAVGGSGGGGNTLPAAPEMQPAAPVPRPAGLATKALPQPLGVCSVGLHHIQSARTPRSDLRGAGHLVLAGTPSVGAA